LLIADSEAAFLARECEETKLRTGGLMPHSADPLNKQSTRIGIIGLGLMGSRLAERLHSAGWKVKAWNRSPEAAQAIGRTGIRIASSLSELVSDSDVILSSLANDEAVRAVYLDEDGVLSIAKPGTIVLEMSTISPELSFEMHRMARERGQHALDVAISGSTPAVEAGTITLLAGGHCTTFEQCVPLFESIAKQWFFIGPGSSGIRMKLVVNLLLGVGMQAIAEAVSLGERLEIEEPVLLDVLSKTAVIAPAFLGKFQKIRSGDYSPEFPLRLMSKDLNLALEADHSLKTRLPAATAAQQLFAEAAPLDGDLDLSAVVPLVAGHPIRA
jgi:3-hydroxyisobutyrate dehydrogenase